MKSNVYATNHLVYVDVDVDVDAPVVYLCLVLTCASPVNVAWWFNSCVRDIS